MACACLRGSWNPWLQEKSSSTKVLSFCFFIETVRLFHVLMREEDESWSSSGSTEVFYCFLFFEVFLYLSFFSLVFLFFTEIIIIFFRYIMQLSYFWETRKQVTMRQKFLLCGMKFIWLRGLLEKKVQGFIAHEDYWCYHDKSSFSQKTASAFQQSSPPSPG